MNFEAQLLADQARIASHLDSILGSGNALDDAMRHAVLAGGKRLRAFLVYESSRICQADVSAADAGAAAIELMHAYSLVHDDLPCMDDDDWRRGEPTVHVKWNEWVAVLAGDALQALAFEVLTSAPHAVELVANLAKSAGRHGMVRGQFLDLQSENSGQSLKAEALEALQNDKTGALISWAAQFGAVTTGQDAKPFAEYARHLGLAFQIWDDVLDVEASSEVLGKTAGKDMAAGKVTWVSGLGVDGAKARARAEIDAAKSAISPIRDSQNLSQLADFVISRSY